MSPIVFHDGVTVTPNSIRFTIWRNALRMVDHLSTAMCAVSNIQYIQGIPELHTTHEILDEEYMKQNDLIWLYSEDIMRFGTEDDRDKMEQWASDCEQKWDGDRWIDLQ